MLCAHAMCTLSRAPGAFVITPAVCSTSLVQLESDNDAVVESTLVHHGWLRGRWQRFIQCLDGSCASDVVCNRAATSRHEAGASDDVCIRVGKCFSALPDTALLEMLSVVFSLF